MKKSKAMCAIFGGFISKELTEKAIVSMSRGNDGYNIKFFEEAGLSFGFKRHSIVAPEDNSSMQPIISKHHNYAMVMNGEIFNYKKLRTILKKNKFYFTSKGDVEVLLALYCFKDLDFCTNLNSMHAAAIYDKIKQKIVLTRDWVGEEPLHYIYDKPSRTFVFSSEIKGFKVLPDYDFSKILALEPGTNMELDLKTFELKTTKYYNLSETKDEKNYKNMDQIGKKVRKLLEQSAKERVVADVPLCCMLSGGVDSAITAFLLKKALKEKGKDLKCYVFHVKEEPITPGTDIYNARKVAKEFGLDKNLVEVFVSREDIIKAIPEVIYALEDKRSKDFNLYPSIYNFFLAKRIAKDGFKLVFNGEGSDELQGSYANWGGFQVDQNEIVKTYFRIKMIGNLHKGILMRTSKVLMNAGPLEARTFFLDKDVAEYMVNIPPKFLRNGDSWKEPLVYAFKKDIPIEFLRRPKKYPQDATGLTAMRSLILERYKKYGFSETEIINNIFNEQFLVKKN